MFCPLLTLVIATVSIVVPSVEALATLPPLTKYAQYLPLAKEALAYFDASPDPFHCVETSASLLSEAGFVELDEKAPYSSKLEPGETNMNDKDYGIEQMYMPCLMDDAV